MLIQDYDYCSSRVMLDEDNCLSKNKMLDSYASFVIVMKSIREFNAIHFLNVVAGVLSKLKLYLCLFFYFFMCFKCGSRHIFILIFRI